MLFNLTANQRKGIMVTKTTKLLDIASTYLLPPSREERGSLCAAAASDSREKLSGQFIQGQDIVRRVVFFDAGKEREGLKHHIITTQSGKGPFGKTNWDRKMNKDREARVSTAISIFESTTAAIRADFEKIKQLTALQGRGRFTEARLIELITLAASSKSEDLSLKKIKKATEELLREIESEEKSTRAQFMEIARTEDRALRAQRSVSFKFNTPEELMDNMEPDIDELIFLFELHESSSVSAKERQEYLPTFQSQSSLISLADNYSLLFDAMAHEKQLLAKDTAKCEAIEKQLQQFIEDFENPQKLMDHATFEICHKLEQEMDEAHLRIKHYEKEIKFLKLALKSDLEPLKTAREKDDAEFVEFSDDEDLVDASEEFLTEPRTAEPASLLSEETALSSEVKGTTDPSPELLEAATAVLAPVDDHSLTSFVELLGKINPVMPSVTQLLPKDLIEYVDIKEEEGGKKYTVTLTFKDKASGIIKEIPEWNIKDVSFNTSEIITITVLPESKELIFEKNQLSASINKDKIKGLSGPVKWMLPQNIPLYLSKISLGDDKSLSIQGTLANLPISSSVLMEVGDLVQLSSTLDWAHRKSR